ncbi:toxin [Lysinibacillus fusiformis]|uniref:BinA4 protein n=2 Tax=Lysinibacillus sphaericus TaxID=1421 RepID=O32300_LYSSH|nr:toxin [Lysinibacillus sphaericus]MEE3806724.1 toxin [Lysinibacillus fusiformis]QTB24420.1 toxin [Lysinibacillus sphaericus]CAA04291.1 BinA4 protein [Lysinibacillus sphaericus]
MRNLDFIDSFIPTEGKYIRVMDFYNSEYPFCIHAPSAPNGDIMTEICSRENNQYFIFFPTDDGRVIIANRHNGSVFTGEATSVVSDIYTGSPSQFFREVKRTMSTYYLAIQNPESATDVRALEPNSHELPSRLYFTNNIENNSNILISNKEQIYLTLPSLPENEQYPKTPVLSGIDDIGPNQSEKSIIGSTLIPCIMVSDFISLGERMKTTPYYYVKHTQYWQSMWSALFPPGSKETKTEKSGITDTSQISMTDGINVSIGADFGLKFGNKTFGIKGGFTYDTKTQITNTSQLLIETTYTREYTNTENFPVRYTGYVLASEFTLHRSDGTQVNTIPWVALNDNYTTIARYPHFASEPLLGNTKIITDDQN